MDDSLPCLAFATGRVDDPRAGARAGKWLRAAMLACEDRALRAPLSFALLAVLALLALSVAVLRISYETNDDVFMTMIVAGQGFCPRPDEHLIFSNILLGHGLKQLYLAWPQVPWYGCYLLGVHYLAQVALLYCALKAVPRLPEDERRTSFRRRLAVYLAFFAVVELVLLNSLQFTSTAFLAAQAGIFLLLLAMRSRTLQPEMACFGPLCAGVALIVVGGLVRFESLCLALVMVAPLVLVMAWTSTRRALIPSSMAAIVAGMLVTVAVAYDRASYDADPAWSDFHAYNQLRCKFNDYQWTSYSPHTAPVFSAVGWSESDHAMIAHWFFDDPVLYSKANLRFVLAAYPWKTARLTTGYLWQTIRRPLRDRAVWAVMLVLPFCLASMHGVRHARSVIVATTILALMLILLIGINNKVAPLRLYFPLLAFPLAATLLFPSRRTAWEGMRGVWATQSRSASVVVVLLIVGVTMGVYRQCRRSLRIERERTALAAFLDDARAAKDKLYVCWEAALPFELVSPLDSLASWSGISLVNLTWTQRTPWTEEIKLRYGITNLAQAIGERDGIVLVATETHRSAFAKFAQAHLRAEVEFVQSRSYGKKFTAGQFHPTSQPGLTAVRAERPVPR